MKELRKKIFFGFRVPLLDLTFTPRIRCKWHRNIGSATLAFLAVAGTVPPESAAAGPSAAAAKKCMHFSYIAYPYKRPGAVRMSGDRQAFFKDCMSKDGNVPEPSAPSKES